MLDASGFSFVGSPHSGLDDSINIARLVIRLIEDGCKFIVNERIFSSKLQTNLQAFKKKGEVVNLNRSEGEALANSYENDNEESSSSSDEEEGDEDDTGIDTVHET